MKITKPTETEDLITRILYSTNNEPHLAKTILSYLCCCDSCKKYDEIKIYYVKACGYNGQDNRYDDGFRIMKLCYTCFVKIMLDHIQGKNGVLTIKEWEAQMKLYQ